MPNLKTATQPVDTSQMTMVPPPSPTMRPPLGQISADPEFSPLSLAPTPSVMSTQVDASRQFYRQSVSQVRMPPLQPSSSVAVGSQIQSHITAAANDSGSSVNPTFEVNNVENPVQNILNITGAGVSYGPGAGEVQISSAVVTTITAGGSSLASGAIGESTLVLAPTFTIISVACNGPLRLRLYSSAAAQTADLNRPNTVPPTPGTDHGVICDLYLQSSGQYTLWTLSPIAPGANQETPQTSNCYCSITNLSAITASPVATISWI
jgi:hypothetical protein